MSQYKRVKAIFFAFFKIVLRPFIGTRFATYIYDHAPVIRLMYSTLFCFLAPHSVQVNDFTVFLNPRDSIVSGALTFDCFEKFETEFIQRHVRDGMVAFDMGANIGYYTLLLSKFVGESGGVYAFEPDPDNAAILKKNIHVNHCGNAHLIQKAVSNRTGKGTLFLSAFNTGDHRIYEAEDARKSVVIDTIRIDDWFKGVVDFIKMDIQGAEGNALDGMIGLLNRSKRVVIVSEFWPFGLERSGYVPENFLETLNTLGFSMRYIDEQNRSTDPISAKEAMYMCADGKKHINILFTRD